MINFVCEHCCKPFFRKQRLDHGNPFRFCSRTCSLAAMQGEDAPNYKTGRTVPKRADLYVRSLQPGHPRAFRNSIYEHIVVAELVLGKPLPLGACVHHVDENRHNNSSGNLVICQDVAYHNLLHARLRRLRDCGSLALRRCEYCRIAKPLEEFHKHKSQWDGVSRYCKDCSHERSVEKWKHRCR